MLLRKELLLYTRGHVWRIDRLVETNEKRWCIKNVCWCLFVKLTPLIYKIILPYPISVSFCPTWIVLKRHLNCSFAFSFEIKVFDASIIDICLLAISMDKNVNNNLFNKISNNNFNIQYFYIAYKILSQKKRINII